MRPIITLTTDFGRGDYDTGVLSGVIWSIAPRARVVDLSHEIARHNVLEAALMLERCTPYFPPGTIHVAVVDPGVGTGRRGLAARLGRQWFVGPDNGLLTLMRKLALQQGLPVEIVQLNKPEFWLREVSAIFHGRDIFAPVAAHLAAGTRLDEIGERITDPVLLEIPEPSAHCQRLAGDGDACGCLWQPLHQPWTGAVSARPRQVEVRIGQTTIRELKAAFSDGAPGELVALIDSSGKLCVSVVNGDAAERLGVQVGDSLEVKLG